MIKLKSLALVLAAFSLAACEKNAVQDITGPLPSARIRFFNFAVGAPGVNFYANDSKVTAISSASCPNTSTDPRCTSTGIEATTGVIFGGVGSSGRYAAIAPGQYTFSGRIAGTTDTNLPIANVPFTIADGKIYSMYLSGVYNTATKTSDAFVVEDNYPAAIDWTTAHVRFVNASANSTPLTLVLRNRETLVETVIGGPVAYKAGSAFVPVANASYDLFARTATGTAAITRTAVAFTNGTVYTITARGQIAATSPVPFLDNTINR